MIYEVGESYAMFQGRQDGVHLSIADSGLMLTCLFDRPTSAEVKAFHARQPLSVRVMRKYDLLTMCLRFGQLSWMDCTYTPHIGSDPDLPPVDDGQGYALHILLFDTSTGTLKQQRLVSLSTEVSRRIREIIQDLRATPFSQPTYQKQLNLLYSLYSTDDLAAQYEAKCTL